MFGELTKGSTVHINVKDNKIALDIDPQKKSGKKKPATKETVE